jgi:hypothetical protein
MIVKMMQRARLNEMKNRFKVQSDPAKKPYMTPVNAIVAAYIPAVDPIRIHCHKLEFVEFSQFSRHISDQQCAKSTRRTRPRRMNNVAPMRAT